MTTKTPIINDHGEETKKPQFGPGSDDANTTGNPSDPRGDVAAGDSSNPRGDKPEKSLSDDQLAQKESNTNGTESSLGSDEKSGFFKGEESPGGLTKLKGRLTKNPRNKLMIGLIAGVLGFGGFAGFTIVQGPLEFIHFAQIMQKFHFRANEDFGDDMAMRRLVYALGGEGERGRLGATLNVVADRWEKKLAQTTGLRPIYDKKTGVFGGFAIVNEKLAASLVNDLEASGGKTTLAKDAGGSGIKGTKNKKNPIDPNTRIIDFRGQSVPESVKRSVISRVGKNTGTHALTGSLGSRLLKKRARVNFSPLTGKIRKYSDILAEKRAQKDKLRQDLATQDKIGVDSTKLGTVLTNGVDQNGNPITDPNAQQVAQDGAEAIQDFQNAQETPNGQTPDSIKTKIIAGLKPSPAAIVGVLCSARSFGKDIPKYRYTHIILPVMRLGVRVIAAGNGVMAGKKVSLAELEAIHDTFYNSDTKTSWSSASTIQAEFGKKSSRPGIPKEASLKNINNKPAVFDTLDNVPGLGAACSVQDAIFGIPGIKQVSQAISSVTTAALGAVGINIDELLGQALAVASGNSVNLLARGEELGNLVNLGSFLGANDAAIAMGGRSLTATEVAELDSQQTVFDNLATNKKSIYEKYFDIYDSGSLTAKMIDGSPKSTNQFASSLLGSFGKIFSFGSLSSIASAATSSSTVNKNPEDLYGAPKYQFSADEMSNQKFANQAENERLVKESLPTLNDKYGKCFSKKLIYEDNDFYFEDGDSVNIADPALKFCNETNDELLIRYRFVIAQAVTDATLACGQGDETDPVTNENCAKIGSGSVAVSQTPTAQLLPGGTPGIPNGSAQELAQKLLDYKAQGKYNCDNPIDCEDLTLMSKGQSIRGGVGCQSDSLDIRVLQLMVALIERNYKIGTYALCRAHRANNGAHPKGMGLDISSINGISVNQSSAKNITLELDKLIFEITGSLAPRQIISGGVGATRRVDPEFVKYNRVAPGNEGQSAVNAFGPDTMSGHTDHIHVGY